MRNRKLLSAYIKYLIFIMFGILFFTSVLLIHFRISDLERMDLENRKKNLIDVVEHKIAISERQIITIGESISLFFRYSEEVTQEEFVGFVSGILKEHAEIYDIIITHDRTVSMSFKNQEYVGRDFDLVYPSFPIIIDGIKYMAVEFDRDARKKVIVIIPFSYLLSGEITVGGNYKLFLLDPTNQDILFATGNIEQQRIEPTSLDQSELDSVITIEKETDLFGAKIQKKYFLNYTIWSERFEEKNENLLLLIGGSSFAAIITFLLIWAEMYKIRYRDAAKSLQLSNQYLKDIDRQKSIFATVLTHELKTPLMPILGYCKMLLNSKIVGNLNDEQKDAIKTIQDNGKRLYKLISDVSDSRSAEIGQMRITLERFAVSDLIHEVESTFSTELIDLGIKFTVVCKTNKEFMTSDRLRLMQVIDNLITNAKNAILPKTGKIEFGVSDDSRSFQFYVKDDGVGIPKEKHRDVFLKFYQIDNSLSRRIQGMGLGLSICMDIVNALKGKIWFESSPSKGSIFYFTIPLTEIEVKARLD